MDSSVDGPNASLDSAQCVAEFKPSLFPTDILTNSQELGIFPFMDKAAPALSFRLLSSAPFWSSPLAKSPFSG